MSLGDEASTTWMLPESMWDVIVMHAAIAAAAVLRLQRAGAGAGSRRLSSPDLAPIMRTSAPGSSICQLFAAARAGRRTGLSSEHLENSDLYVCCSGSA
jgi:hypothetical protein